MVQNPVVCCCCVPSNTSSPFWLFNFHQNHPRGIFEQHSIVFGLFFFANKGAPVFSSLCACFAACHFFVFLITGHSVSTERPVTKPVVVVVAFRPIRLSLFFLAKMTTFIFEQHSNVFSSFFQTPKLVVPCLCNPSHTVCSLFLLKTLNKPIFLQKAYQNQYKMHLRRLQKSSKSNQNHCIYHARYGFLRFWI